MYYSIVNPQILTLYVWSYKDLSKIAFNHINFDHNDLRSCIRRMCHTWVSCFSQRSQSKASDFKLHYYIAHIAHINICWHLPHIEIKPHCRILARLLRFFKIVYLVWWRAWTIASNVLLAEMEMEIESVSIFRNFQFHNQHQHFPDTCFIWKSGQYMLVNIF